MHRTYGHETLRTRLEGALASSRFPQAVLLSGPQGAGKQRLALWIAQHLLCETSLGAACGQCPSCRRIAELTHPDLSWFVPVVRSRTTDPKKQIEVVEEQLGEVMAERRATPLYAPPEGQASHSLASVRLLQRKASLTPFQGPRKVFILGDAERLVVQEASQEAANALLKVLEEPPTDTTLILTAARPQQLLPTIRSRCVPVRVARVSDEVVRDFLTSELSPPLSGRGLERAIQLAAGCIGRVVGALEFGDRADRSAERFVRTVRAGPAAWAGEALAQAPWGARGGFTAMLDALAMRVRHQLAEAAERGEPDAGRFLEAVRRVEDFRTAAQGM